MHTVTFFPQIVRRKWQLRFGIAEAHEEISSLHDQSLEHVFHETDVSEFLEVLPKRPQNKRRFVFLNGQLLLAVYHPRMPAGSQRFIRIVFVQQIAFVSHYLSAEREEILS